MFNKYLDVTVPACPALNIAGKLFVFGAANMFYF